MATRVKESGVIRGKEKKGMSPSSHATHVDSMPQHKRATNTSKLISSGVGSVPNYLKPTASSTLLEGRQIQGDKPSPARRKSLDRPPSHLDSHRNLGDKPSLARRKSFDRPPHSLSSASSQGRPTQGNKPALPRTKSSLDKPQPSAPILRSNVPNAKGKMMRSISAVGKSSSITPRPLKPLSDRPTTAKSQNNPRKQLDILSSRPVKKRQEIITSNQEPSATEGADTEVTNVNSNHTEVSNNKIVQEKENIILADEELEDLKSFEHCSLLAPEYSGDHVDTIEGDEVSVEITVPEKFQESDESVCSVLIAGEPHVEDDGENKSKNMKETISVVDPKFADDVPVEEKGGDGNEKMLLTCNNSDNYIDDKEGKQEKEEEREKEKDKKGDHHQELAEEVKETTENNNNVVAVPTTTTHQLPEVKVVQAAKKNESVVSNDVIEETASKLREQRKNKVKALAGAFETVISLQDPK